MKHALTLGMLLIAVTMFSGCIIVSSDVECGKPLAASPPFGNYEDFLLEGIARNEALMQNFEAEYEVAYEKVDDKIPDKERVTRMECRQVRKGEKSYYKATRYFADGHKATVESAFDGKAQTTVWSDRKCAEIAPCRSSLVSLEPIDQYTNVGPLPMSELLKQSEILSASSTDIWNEFGAILRIKPPTSRPENREEMKLIFRVEAGVVPFRVERYQTRLSKDPVEEYEVFDMKGVAPYTRVPMKVRSVKYEIVPGGWRIKRSESIIRVSKWTVNPEVPANLFLIAIPKDKLVMDIRSVGEP